MINLKYLLKMIFAFLTALSLSSCSDSLFDLSVQREKPFADVVLASVVAEASSVNGAVLSVSWKKDDGADNYLLMRSEEGKTGYGDFIEVYGGNKTEYLDTSLKKDTSYMYRLDKTRGNTLFAGEEVTLFAHVLADPLPGIISAQSIDEGKSVSLTWQEDAWAEMYIILKTEITDQGIDFTNSDVSAEIIISGKTNYIDNEIESEKSYAYRLDKKRGEEIIEGSEIAIFGRTRNDPFLDAAVIESINDGMAVSLRWNPDSGADSYILMRSDEGLNGYGSFVKVYEGTDTGYIDQSVNKDFSYMYRLDKKRKEKLFPGTEITVFKKTRPDPFQDRIEAKSLRGGKAAYLTWEEDSGADEYKIMRSLNDDNDMQFTARRDGYDSFFMQGKTSALDDNLQDDKSYVYRLDKKRGDRWYEGNEITIFSLTRPLPYGETPRTNGFRTDGSIYVQWNFDEGADTHILMRRFDDSLDGFNEDGSDWKKVYEGNNINFIDEDVDDISSGRYEYRLDKKRNEIVYKWTDKTSLVVAAHAEEDRHEPNNIYAEAVELQTYLESNLYYYRYKDGRELAGSDWYKVFVHPGKTARILLLYGNMANSEWLQAAEADERPASIMHNGNFELKNDTAEKRYIFFEIQPNKQAFLQGLNTGGSIINYTLELVEITDN